MKTLSVNDEITVSGLHRTITAIRWQEKSKGELIEKESVLWPDLDWCILSTNAGERITVNVLENENLRLKGLLLNGLSIKSNQYDYPCKTYWYIANKMNELYHHKDKKWRKKELKEMTTYYFTTPEAALKCFVNITN